MNTKMIGRFFALAIAVTSANSMGCEKPNDDTSVSLQQSLREWSDYRDCNDTIAMASGDSEQALEALIESRKAEERAEELRQLDEFFGPGWGIGVGAGFGQGADRIDGAELVDGIVRVNQDVTDSPRLFLEIHYFFDRQYLEHKWGHGPFATVNFGANGADTLTSFGVGYMVGYKRPDSSSSFNIGVGIALDSNVMQLGDGLSEDQPLPDGETEIRFKQSSEPALILLVSTKF